MAITNNHWPPGTNVAGGARLNDALKQFEAALVRIVRELATLEATMEGNGTDLTHFLQVNLEYGFNGTDKAQAARNELLNGIGFIDPLGNDQNAVGKAAQTALNQLFTRLR